MIRRLREQIALYTLRAIMESPKYYPVHIDVERQRMSFVRLTKETYSGRGFQAHPCVHPGQLIFNSGMNDLLYYDSRTAAGAARVRYILISAFCCSTLLVRYLQMIPVVLK